MIGVVRETRQERHITCIGRQAAKGSPHIDSVTSVLRSASCGRSQASFVNRYQHFFIPPSTTLSPPPLPPPLPPQPPTPPSPLPTETRSCPPLAQAPSAVGRRKVSNCAFGTQLCWGVQWGGRSPTTERGGNGLGRAEGGDINAKAMKSATNKERRGGERDEEPEVIWRMKLGKAQLTLLAGVTNNALLQQERLAHLHRSTLLYPQVNYRGVGSSHTHSPRRCPCGRRSRRLDKPAQTSFT